MEQQDLKERVRFRVTKSVGAGTKATSSDSVVNRTALMSRAAEASAPPRRRLLSEQQSVSVATRLPPVELEALEEPM